MQRSKFSDELYCFILYTILLQGSALPCFAALGEQTAQQLRERFMTKLSQQAATELIDRLIVSSLGSNWTRLYDSVGSHQLEYWLLIDMSLYSSNITLNRYYKTLRLVCDQEDENSAREISSDCPCQERRKELTIENL